MHSCKPRSGCSSVGCSRGSPPCLPLPSRSLDRAVEPRQLYTRSPTADKAARQGLGGIQVRRWGAHDAPPSLPLPSSPHFKPAAPLLHPMQGLAVLAGAGAVVALVTLGIASNPEETLSNAAASLGGDSLSAIAARL